MPVLVSRTPLEPLSNMNAMSSNAGTSSTRAKRKPPTRLNFLDDDGGFEDAPAKKKMKADDGRGRTNGAVEKKAKNVYEEQSDGFVFSRRQPKRGAKAEEMTYEPVVESQTRRKKTSLTPPTEDERPKRRRSARLSGEKEKEHPQSLTAVEAKPKAKRIMNAPVLAPPNDRGDSPEGEVPSLQVEKGRDGTKIALPFADTPVMKRNKEMREKSRKTSSSKNRRSSTGIRGRRASSLIESGTSNAVPHADVEISDFYKLIEDGLPEPKRFKQLLTWCASRALIDKPRPTSTSNRIETIAIESARQIQEELIKDFASKSELSDWWSERDEPVPSRPQKPNPRNVRNEAKIKELEAEIQRLETEEATWKSLLPSKASKKPASPTLETSSINSSLLSASQQSLLSLLDSTISTAEATETQQDAPFSASVASRIKDLTSNLEPTIDLLADGVHHLSQFNQHASHVADRVKGVWARRLERREEEAQKEAGSSEFGARDVLRALSGKMIE